MFRAAPFLCVPGKPEDPSAKGKREKKDLDKYRAGVYKENRKRYPGGVYGISGKARDTEDRSMTDLKEQMEIMEDDTEPACPHCGARHKKRTEEEQRALLTRLRKVEGQIRGIEKMVEADAYCPDILVQVSAATSALNSFNKQLLACHIKSCVAEDIREGKDETIDELCRVLQKLMR